MVRLILSVRSSYPSAFITIVFSPDLRARLLPLYPSFIVGLELYL